MFVIIVPLTLYRVDNYSDVAEATNKGQMDVYLAHLDIVVDGRDVQRTTAVVIGRVDSVGPLGEEPIY